MDNIPSDSAAPVRGIPKGPKLGQQPQRGGFIRPREVLRRNSMNRLQGSKDKLKEAIGTGNLPLDQS